MPPIAAMTLSLAMIAAFLLAAVGAQQTRKTRDPVARRRGLLMVVMSLVLIANVLIWTV